ncbi:MAG: MFS transporter [Phocaeicola sp.]
MFFIACSNFLLYASSYLLLPVLSYWLLIHWNCNYAEAGVITTLPFIAGLFPFGPLNSYLIDRFKRKKVCLISLLLMVSLTLFYPYVETLCGFALMRFAQGVLFGVITMTTGSTLVIDLAVSKMRTLSNRTFVRFGRFGIAIGVALGIYIFPYWTIQEATLVSVLLAGGAMFLILLLTIQFRAPLQPSKFSLDRFILPAAILPGINMLFAPFVLGILIASQNDEYFFLSLFLSFFVSYLLHKFFGDRISLRQEIELGYLLLGIGLCLLYFIDSLVATYVGAFFIGSGIGMVSNRFLIMMVSLPLHCGRGSGNNTYQLFWEVGVLAGFCTNYLWLNYNMGCVNYFALACCVVGLLIYELVVHRWYHKQMEEKY